MPGLVGRWHAEFRIAELKLLLEHTVDGLHVGAGGGHPGFLHVVDLDQQVEPVLRDDQEVGPVAAGEDADGLNELAHLLAVIEQDFTGADRGRLLESPVPPLDSHLAPDLG